MTGLNLDTDPKAEILQIELLRQAPPWRKLELVEQLNQAVRDLNLAGLAKRFPADSPGKLKRRLADLLLGEGLAEKVYGPMI